MIVGLGWSIQNTFRSFIFVKAWDAIDKSYPS